MRKSNPTSIETDTCISRPPIINYEPPKSFTDALNNLQKTEGCSCGTFACLEYSLFYERRKFTMRLTNLYQVYDKEAHATAGAIFPEKRDAPAIRAFYELFTQKNTMPGKYPEHFELRHVGVQDEETGQITAESPPSKITDGTAWLAVQNLKEDNC